MFRKISQSLLYSVVIVVMLAGLFACTPATQAPTAAPTNAPAAVEPTKAAAPSGGTLAVGIVLPTKDEPRWIQDETRFKDALTKAGYDVQILFSQGDSAKEKANVESLISQGIKVLIICPQDATAAAAAAQAARDAGVKVISYDRLIRETDAVAAMRSSSIRHSSSPLRALFDTLACSRESSPTGDLSSSFWVSSPR